MGKHSPQYLDHAWSIDGKPWRATHPYVEGVRVTWRGVRLVCTLGHYCGHASDHPWDPGYGWPESKAAALWTPDGEGETAKLAWLLSDTGPLIRERDGRLIVIAAYAAGLVA